MTHQDQIQPPPSLEKKKSQRLATWERKFRQAKTPGGRHYAMSQIWRCSTEDHPLVQLWLNRDPRFNDMTWTFPS
jgi:hypothetical protein